MSEALLDAGLIESLTAPLDGEDGPCGPDLEYDGAFLELTQAAAGKPETQFEAAVPPDWREVRILAETLMERTRDLRIALLWLRAGLNQQGLRTLPAGLELMRTLLETYWETLHPRPDPDDGDLYARINTLSEVCGPLLGDARHSVVFVARGFGEIRVRQVEIALGHLSPRDGEAVLGRDQLQQLLAAAQAQDPVLAELPTRALQSMKALEAAIDERFGTDAPDLKPLRALLQDVASLSSTGQAGTDGADAGPVATDQAPAMRDVDVAAGAGGLSGGIRSREDVLRAIDMACEFLERTEPTNPAPLFLRRARRLVNHNFLQLVKELAPDALAEVARLTGVDPESVQVEP